MGAHQDIIEQIIDYIDKAILRNSVSNRHVATVLSYLHEDLKNCLRKDQEDATPYLIRFLGGLFTDYIKSMNYSSGPLGEGFIIKVDPQTGKSYIEVDELFVRIKAMFSELEIKKLSYAGGNYMFTAAGVKCAKVEEYDTYWRCYFIADDGETAVENEFRLDDFIRYGDFNIKPGVYENVANRFYWRCCVGIGDNYIDLSKTDSEAPDNDYPKEGDSLVQLGNRTDKKRQNAIVVSVYGDDAPSIHQYAGIDSYSMAGKEVTVISPNGNKFTGDFILKTGINILTQFKVLEDLIYSEASKIYDEVQTKDNYLSNSAFASNTNGWETTTNIRFFTVNGKFLFFNNNFYSRKDNMAAIVRYGNRNVLRIIDSGIKQLNADLAEHPKEQKTFFISFRYRVIRSGTLTVGFPGQKLYFTEHLEGGQTYRFKEYSGLWDGTGDFEFKFTGEMYIHSLALAASAFDDMLTNVKTEIQQTNERIELLAESTSRTDESLRSSIGIVSGEINAVSTRVSGLEKASAGWITNAEGNKLWASKTLEDGNVLISYINQAASSTTIHSSKINLEGAVTMTALNNELRTKVNNALGRSDLGSLAFKDAVETAQLGSTIIVGGYLNTDLIKVRRIDADAGFVGGFTIEGGRLIWTRSDYFGGTSRSLKLGSGTAKEGVVNVTFNSTTDGRFGVSAMGASAGGSAAIYGSSNMYSPNYPDNYIYAGFFDGNVRILGDVSANGFFVKGDDGEYLSVISGSFVSLDQQIVKVVKGLIVSMKK